MKTARLLGALASLLVVQCTQPDPAEPSAPGDPAAARFTLTPAEAVDEAREARAAIAPATRSGVVEVRSVVRHRAQAADAAAEVNPSLYVVNFAADGGFAIVAADRRQSATVYAVSDEGSFPDPATLGDGTLDMLFSRIETLAAAPASARSGSYATGVWKDTKRKAPLVAMRWGVEAPFNQWDEVTALCQIMSCYEWPAWYDWASIKSLVCAVPNNPADSVRDAKITALFADVAAAYCLSKQEWLEKLNYTCDASEPYRYETIVGQIDRGRPVYATGFTLLMNDILVNHGWVMDGYLEQTRTFYPIIDPVDPEKPGWGKLAASDQPYTETRTLVHCNLCNDGRGNGYYLSTLFRRSHAQEPDEGVLPDYDSANDTLRQIRITPNIRKLTMLISVPPKS